MTSPPDLWSRIKQTRVVRVLLVYLGASWILLQVASTVVDAFKLPDIVLPATIILLAIGVIVIVATAWVQSLTSTTKGEEAGALPTDWQIAPRDAIASLKQGRLPHLTWGRVLAGGVAALVVLFAPPPVTLPSPELQDRVPLSKRATPSPDGRGNADHEW